MPEVELPDGTVLDFPDGVSQEEITGMVNKYAAGQNLQAPSLGEKALEAVAPIIRGMTPTSAGAMAGYVLSGGKPTGAAAGAAVMEVVPLLVDSGVHVLNKFLGTDYVAPSQTIQEALSKVGLPESQTESQKLVEAASKGVAGAVATAGLGRMMAGGVTRAGLERGVAQEVGKALAESPGKQMIAGATGGLAAEATRQKLETMSVPDWVRSYVLPLAEFSAGVVGGALGARTAGLVFGLRGVQTGSYPARPGLSSEQVGETIAAMEAKGQQVPTSYAFPPEGQTGRTLQRLARAGSAGELDQEMLAFRNKEVEDFFRSKGITSSSTPQFLQEVTADLDRTRTANIVQNKQAVLGVLADGDAVGAMVPVDNSVSVIDSYIKQFKQENPRAFEPAIQKLTQIKYGLLGEPVPIDPNDLSKGVTFPGKTLSQVDANRDLVGSMTSDPSLASIKTRLQKASDDIYGAIKDDMRSFLKDNELQADLWDSATAKLAESAKQLDSAALRAALNKGQVMPEAAQRLLFSSNPSEVELLFKNLSPEGKRNAKFALLEKAYSDSINPNTGEISTVRVQKRLSELANEYKIAFSSSDLKDLEGITNMLKLTAPAIELTADPATGARNTTPLVALAMLTSKGAAKTIGSAMLLDRVAAFYESPIARKILKAIPRFADNPSEQLALTKRFITAAEVFNDQKAVEALEQNRVAATFLPQNTEEEQIGDTIVKTDQSLKMRMYLSPGKPVRLVDSNNNLIGIFNSEQAAVKKSSDMAYKAIKEQIRQKQKAYATR